jgi:O-antigen ligase
VFPTTAYSARQDFEPVGFIDLTIIVGLMALMAFTALAFGAVEPWSLATFGLLSIALLSLWAVKGVGERRLRLYIPATTYPLLALIALGLAQGISVTDSTGKRFSISLDPEATRLTTESLLVLLIVFLVSANFLTGERRLIWLRNFLIFFGLGLSVFGLVQKFTWNGKYYWVIEPSVPPSSPFGPFVNHNHFAGYVEMIAPIPLALIIRRVVRGELAVLYGFAAAMMSLAVVMSLSRGGAISLVASLMFVVVFGFKSTSRDSSKAGRSSNWALAPARIGAMLLIFCAVGAGVWWVGADPVIRRVEKAELVMDAPSKDPGKETFFQSRGFIWRDTVSMIRDNWTLGIGLGAFHTAYPIYSTRDGTLIVSQAHNDYLQVMADGGILGAIIALWFLFLVARDMARAGRHRNPNMAAMALGCAGGVFALMVHSLFDFNFQIPSNALLFLILTAVVSQIAAAASLGRSGQADTERAAWLKAAA